MELSVIIVNWKSVHWIGSCLDSVLRYAGELKPEVVVVDNASYDGCANLIRDQFPSVVFVQSTRNLGFARANNLGAKRSTGQVLLFLNPDTAVSAGAIGGLYNFIRCTFDAGVVGCRILNTDRTLQTSCVRAFPTVLNQMIDSDVLRKKFPLSELWGTAALFRSDACPAQVDAISGACIMVRRDVFERVGGFCSDFFMYGEDMDLCYRIHRHGFQNYYLGKETILHHGGGSSANQGDASFSSAMIRESGQTYFRRNHGAVVALLYRAAMGCSGLLRLSILVPCMLFVREEGRRVTTLRSIRKWWVVLRWSLGLEQWVKWYPESRPSQGV